MKKVKYIPQKFVAIGIIILLLMAMFGCQSEQIEKPQQVNTESLECIAKSAPEKLDTLRFNYYTVFEYSRETYGSRFYLEKDTATIEFIVYDNFKILDYKIPFTQHLNIDSKDEPFILRSYYVSYSKIVKVFRGGKWKYTQRIYNFSNKK